MNCIICGASPVRDGVTLYRQNEKGSPGIWLCGRHAKHGKQPAPEVLQIIQVIQGSKKDSPSTKET